MKLNNRLKTCFMRILFIFTGLGIAILAYFSVAIEQFVITIIITFSVWFCCTYVDGRSLTALGVRRFSWSEILNGALSVFLSLIFVFLIEWGIGWIELNGFGLNHISGNQMQPGEIFTNLFPLFVVAILTAWREEVLFRGYVLKTISGGTNIYLGLISSSILFGAFHVFLNKNLLFMTLHEMLSIFIFTLFAGLVLGLAYIRSRKIWFSVGVHFAWNFLKGPIFGFRIEQDFSLISQKFIGPKTFEHFSSLFFGLNDIIILLVVLGLIYFFTIANDKKIQKSRRINKPHTL